MRSTIGVAVLALATVVSTSCVPAFAQSASGTSPIYAELAKAFDLNDTNSLVNANEINVTPLFKWDGQNSRAGGGIRADWWVTDQQGAFLGFDEYAGRESYFSLGYQARTVFKSVEVALGFGTRQSSVDPFGEVELFLSPSLSVRVLDREDFDLRITLGADLTAGDRPTAFLGLTLRAFKF